MKTSVSRNKNQPSESFLDAVETISQQPQKRCLKTKTILDKSYAMLFTLLQCCIAIVVQIKFTLLAVVESTERDLIGCMERQSLMNY